MPLVATLGNTKWCKKTAKWHVGTHLRVLCEIYPMNTNMTGLDGFQKPLPPCALEGSILSIGMVKLPIYIKSIQRRKKSAYISWTYFYDPRTISYNRLGWFRQSQDSWATEPHDKHRRCNRMNDCLKHIGTQRPFSAIQIVYNNCHLLLLKTRTKQ